MDVWTYHELFDALHRRFGGYEKDSTQQQQGGAEVSTPRHITRSHVSNFSNLNQQYHDGCRIISNIYSKTQKRWRFHKNISEKLFSDVVIVCTCKVEIRK